MSTDETLTLRTNHRDHIEYETPDGDLLVLHQVMVGDWLVTATISDRDLTQVQGRVIRNEAGFAGRNWESAIDGQQYPSLQAAAREALSIARRRADLAAFVRVQEDRKARPAQYVPVPGLGSVVIDTETGRAYPAEVALARAEYRTRYPQVVEAEALLRANGMESTIPEPEGISADNADAILANHLKERYAEDNTSSDEPFDDSIPADETGWMRVSDLGDGTFRVDDETSTVKSLTFGGSQAEANARAAAISLNAAMERSEDDLHAKRAEWLPVARATLGQDPSTGDDVAPTTILADVIAKALTPVPGIEPVEAQRQMAEAVLKALEVAGFVVLDSCARCGEDPRAHWCADLEETFN